MATEELDTLEKFRIPGLPEAGYYVPNFISPEHEEFVLQEIKKFAVTKWTLLSHRRLLSLPSPLTGTARDTLIDAPMPAFLTKIMYDKFSINEYQPGQGIMPHEDGPAYFPLTATISLASHTVLNIYAKNEQGEREASPTWRILQEPRSLLVTTGSIYQDTLHGIDEVDGDRDLGPESIANWSMLADQIPFRQSPALREVRISLTYRDVLKVAKLGGALKFMSKR